MVQDNPQADWLEWWRYCHRKGTVMYGSSSVNSLPVTGVGVAAVSAGANMWGVIILMLAVWTIFAAMKALVRIVPVREE